MAEQDRQAALPRTPNAIAHFVHQILTMDNLSIETVAHCVGSISVQQRMRFIERCTSLANSIADKEAHRQ